MDCPTYNSAPSGSHRRFIEHLSCFFQASTFGKHINDGTVYINIRLRPKINLVGFDDFLNPSSSAFSAEQASNTSGYVKISEWTIEWEKLMADMKRLVSTNPRVWHCMRYWFYRVIPRTPYERIRKRRTWHRSWQSGNHDLSTYPAYWRSKECTITSLREDWLATLVEQRKCLQWIDSSEGFRNWVCGWVRLIVEGNSKRLMTDRYSPESIF